jgi:putative endonuclease
LAAAWYRDCGYQVLARNWRTRSGELDLVAVRDATLVFCEVKARTTDAFGIPAEAVNRAKQLRIRRLAAQWMASHPATRGRQIRFDVACVLGDALEVIEGAF